MIIYDYEEVVEQNFMIKSLANLREPPNLIKVTSENIFSSIILHSDRLTAFS